MTIGEKIKARRKELKMTQTVLADTVGVTAQAVSQWEQGKSFPDYMNIGIIADALQVRPAELWDDDSTMPVWVLQDRLFSEDHMYTRMKAFAQAEQLPQTMAALKYARARHEGQTRKPSLTDGHKNPYIMHPLLMACHAHAMGIRNDEILASIMLHDISEDCGVKPEDLPEIFGPGVRKAVKLLTKAPKKGEAEQQTLDRYYEAIASDMTATIVKVIDRCNNVSMMALAFRREKLIEYIEETEHYILPLLKNIKENAPQYNDAAFLLSYQLRSMLESLKAMIVLE